MRKLKQRLFSLLLCAALAVSLCPAALAADGSGGTISDGTEADAILSIFGAENVTVDTDNKTITLEKDATVSQSVTFDSGSWTLNLNTHTLYGGACVTPLVLTGTADVTLAGTGKLQGGGGSDGHAAGHGAQVSGGTLRIPQRAGIALAGGAHRAQTNSGSGGCGLLVEEGGTVECDQITATAGRGATNGNGGRGIEVNGTLTATGAIEATGGQANNNDQAAGLKIGETGRVSAGSVTAKGGRGVSNHVGAPGIHVEGTLTVTGAIEATGGQGGSSYGGGNGGSGIRLEGGGVISAVDITATGGAPGNNGGQRGGDGIKGYNGHNLTVTGTLTAAGGGPNSGSGFPGGTTPNVLDLTVIDGKADIPYLNKETKTVLPRQTIDIEANDPPEGQQFVRWDVEPEKLASLLGDIYSDSVSFDMPAQDTTGTLTAVYEEIPEIPEEGLCLNDGDIAIYGNGNGGIMAYQNDSQYIVPDGEIRITGKEACTSNTIFVRDATAHITLSNIKQDISDWFSTLTIFDSNVRLTLEGNNTTLAENDVIAVTRTSLTIDGSGTLTVGNAEERGSYGIYIDEASTIINGGVLNIYAQYAAIVGEDSSLTVNGGVIRGDVSGGRWDFSGLGVSGNPSGYSMDIAIHGGTVELTGTNNKIYTKDNNSAVITGGSVTAGGVNPAPTDGTNPVYAVTFEGIGSGTVDALLLKKGEAVQAYGAPACTTTDGKVILYLPEGEYSGMAIVAGRLVTFTCTVSADGTGNQSATTDTGVQITAPEGTKPTINGDGTVTLPGGSTIQIWDRDPVFFPDGGVFDPSTITYTVTVNGGTGGGSYAVGATVTITATVPSGQRFTGWTVNAGGVALANASSATTTFTMPAGNVTVKANFQSNSGSGNYDGGGAYTPPTYPPTVEKPSGGGGTPSISPSNPRQGDTVTVTLKPDDGYEGDTITVIDRNGKSVEVTKKPDGTYTFTQPAGSVTIEVTYQPIDRPWNSPFTDVSEGDWYYEAVRFVQERGLMNGYSDGRFGPNDTLSRAQLAQILFNKEGRPGVNYLLDFSDVAGEAWYTETIRWATSQGIVGGYGNGRFGPNDPITREQLAVMLWRYSGSPAATNKELRFNDADEISPFALEALRWAVENGILNGDGDGRLGPQGQATRAQAAQMLKNFMV